MFFALVFTHLARIEDRFSFRGKSSAARILGTRTECGTMEAIFLTEMGKMLQFVVKNMRKLDCFWAATIGSVSFLVLWHFWVNLVTSMAADHWKVDHVLYYVLRPHRLFKFILVSFTCILLALFRKKSSVTLPLEEDFLPESSVGVKCCHSMLLIFVCIVI